jgi:ribose 5-phosphate isomerase B
MKVVIASDHGGLNLRAALVEFLLGEGHEVEDLGPEDATSVDYPDFAGKVTRAILSGSAERGILVCGTGQGMAMSANKVKGIRAAVVSDSFSAQMAMEHNEAKVLCLGERVLGPSLAKTCVDVWLRSNFEGGRHERRVKKDRSARGVNLKQDPGSVMG